MAKQECLICFSVGTKCKESIQGHRELYYNNKPARIVEGTIEHCINKLKQTLKQSK